MDDEIEAPPIGAKGGKDRVHARFVVDVAGQDVGGAHLIGQRLHPLQQRLTLIGEGEGGTLGRGRPRDAPGDGAVVGDAHDQAALAGHKPAPIAHENPAKAFENKLKAARASYSIEAGGQRAPARNAAPPVSFPSASRRSPAGPIRGRP